MTQSGTVAAETHTRVRAPESEVRILAGESGWMDDRKSVKLL